MLLGREVVRPAISGLMGAFGSALIAHEKARHDEEYSKILSEKELETFVHDSSTARCGLCTNNCLMTINKFGSRKYISWKQM